MPTTHMSSAPLLQVPVIRTFILHSGDEAQCTNKAFVTCVVCSVIELWGPCTCLLS